MTLVSEPLDRHLTVVLGVELSSELRAAIEAVNPCISLGMARTDAELRDAAREADVLFTWAVPANVPEQTPHLRWIQLVSAGADHLVNHPVWSSDVVITSSKGIHAVPIAEHVFGMILAITRGLTHFELAQRDRRWLHGRSQRTSVGIGPFIELYGKTLGIVGWGSIGDGVAHLAHAFGMRVIGTRYHAVTAEPTGRHASPFTHPPMTDPPAVEPDMVYPADQLDAVLRQSDVVVVALPGTSETRHVIGAQQLRAMKPDAILVNVGRGSAINEAALIDAINQHGRGPEEDGVGIRAAALDVFEHEPLSAESPLWSMPNVLITPHVAGGSAEMWPRAVHLFCDNLRRYTRGEPLLNVVDRERGY